MCSLQGKGSHVRQEQGIERTLVRRPVLSPSSDLLVYLQYSMPSAR